MGVAVRLMDVIVPVVIMIVVMAVIMIAVVMVVVGVGSLLRHERARGVRDLKSEPAAEILKHPVGEEGELKLAYLKRGVAVSQVVASLGKGQPVPGLRSHHLLWLGQHLDAHAAALVLEDVVWTDHAAALEEYPGLPAKGSDPGHGKGELNNILVTQRRHGGLRQERRAREMDLPW